jgi:hypothetical protein
MARTLQDFGVELEHSIFKTACGCWLWPNDTHQSYMLMWIDGEAVGVHRASYMLHKGPIPEDKFVLHSCDIPDCVNPTHLFLGTQADNIKDKVAKGRHAYGVRIGTAKLNDEDVVRIRQLLASGKMKQCEIASAYGVDNKIITWIKQGKIWRHVV